MPEEMKIGCARPTGGPVSEAEQDIPQSAERNTGGQAMVTVGKKAPDFVAPAYLKGGFVNIKLSEHLGKWVILCFYPGDFTFV